MTRIGLISDTHGWLDEQVFTHFKNCDEIWHIGDFGTPEVAAQLRSFRPLRGVYGNIDGKELRFEYPERLRFTCEDVNVFMTHIGGTPGRYNSGVKKELSEHPVKLFVCGHSHILRVQYDEQFKCLHINPGAAGRQGWHKIRTIIRFAIEGREIKELEVIELGKR